MTTPISEKSIDSLSVGDMLELSGYIYTGRDAVLPQIVNLYQQNSLDKYNIDLEGSVIFHTAVSVAGVGPTSSNKFEIESTMPVLSKGGVKMHLGKGAIKRETVSALQEYNSAYAVIPPVTALLGSRIITKEIVAFEKEGMEAFHRLKVEHFPIIIAAVNGESIYY